MYAMKNIIISARIAIIALCATLAVACDNTDTDGPSPERYELSRIEWILKEGDGETFVECPATTRVVENSTSEPVTIKINPLENMRLTSEFTTEQAELFAQLNAPDARTLIPSHIELLSHGTWSTMASGTEVPLRTGTSNVDSPTKIEYEYTVPTSTCLQVEATVILRRIRATFRAVYVDPNSRLRVEIEGKWTGLFYERTETEATIGPIEQ